MGEDTVLRTRKDPQMAAKGLALLAAVGVAALSITAANAASPPGTPAASGMTITAADVPGAKVAAQGSLNTNDPDVANAYSRVFRFASPYGASKYIYLKTEVLITTSLDNAATEYHLAGHEFSSKSGQNALREVVRHGDRDEEREERLEDHAACARLRRFGARGRFGRAIRRSASR